ncbi:MAG: nucleotide exchange factor GrpE [Peptoniphilaceae bacterium]|nr:nucleotide exchange factor GrpE [Bacillota bacterium]
MKEKEKDPIPEEGGQEAEIPAEDMQPEEENQEQIESLRTTLARLQADFANYKSRNERERKDLLRLANEGLIMKLLPVVDNFERAFADQNLDDPACAGFHMIYSNLMEVLEKEGVKALESDGEAFDPNLHHALFVEEVEDGESDRVIETFQKGYKMNDKLIRPAMVKVSKHKE